MKQILLALLITGAALSCKQPAGNSTVVKAPVDSLIKNWADSWNNHDSAAVRNMFTTGALLIDDNLVAMNANELSANWISPNINVVTHFKAAELQQWSTGERASYTGKYEFDASVNDSVVAQPKGVFTLIWEKTVAGDWKITSATIHGFTGKK